MSQRMESKTAGKYIAGLHGLRALATLGVVFYHMFPQTVKGGFLGVSLFFVLSGYLMAVTSRRAWKQGRFSPVTFYRNRVVRIYPPLLLMVCATAFFALFFAPDTLRGIRSELFSILIGGNNWWQIGQHADYFSNITGTSPFTHLWSLAIEMQYYLVWPLLFYLCMAGRGGGKSRSVWLLLILAACSMMGMMMSNQPSPNSSRIYYGTDTRIFALLMGSALGMSRMPQRIGRILQNKGYLKLVIFLLSLAGVLLLFFQAEGRSAVTYRAVLPLSGLLFPMLTALVCDRNMPFGRWLDCPPFYFIGERSYEIYLCHYPVIFFVRSFRPDSPAIGNAVIALLLILCISTWLHKVTKRLKSERRLKCKKNFEGKASVC